MLLLNYDALEAGAAIFLSPSTPHAYQRDNALEPMTNSTNVVRAGLPPKFVDKETCLVVLNYDMGTQPTHPADPPQPAALDNSISFDYNIANYG